MQINITDFIPLGIENAISMDELAVRTGSNVRAVRQMVHNARLRGELICSTCDGDSGGYYLPKDAAEAVPYYRQQLSRINSAVAALSAITEFIGGEANAKRV